MMKRTLLNTIKNFGNKTNNIIINKLNETVLIQKNFMNFSCLHRVNSFAFSEKSTMELIKILRAETNSPLNHIKKALQETNNNIEEAKVWLKKKGFKDAENKMSRKAETQISAFAHDENKGLISLSNMLCETDFVASNKMFVEFTKHFANFLLAHQSNIQNTDFVNLKMDQYVRDIDPELKGLSLSECLKYLISKTGENCQIKTLFLTSYNPENEIAGIYLHNTLEETVGKKAAFVILRCDPGTKITENQRKKLKELADQVAMQIIASKPKYLNKEDIPIEILNKESELIKEGILAKKADSSIVSKNDDTDYQNISDEKLNKLIEKKIQNWIENSCLIEQEFVIIDHDAKASHEKTGAVVAKRGKNIGIGNLKIKEFKSFY